MLPTPWLFKLRRRWRKIQYVQFWNILQKTAKNTKPNTTTLMPSSRWAIGSTPPRPPGFRIWATEQLKEYMLKGFILDDERLKNGRYFGKDYFRELQERFRSIRASERRIYQQLTDIFAECSVDYDCNYPEQILLCHHRSDSSRNNLHKGQQRQRVHGSCHLETFPLQGIR